MFFFKQKTAYEMRISDWSSDVCSSDLFPRIAFELLHAEADALGVAVDADDLHVDRVTDVDDFARVVDALVAHVGDMEQAVDAAEVDKRTIIGDVLRSEEHTSELQSLMRISYAVFCLQK